MKPFDKDIVAAKFQEVGLIELRRIDTASESFPLALERLP